VSKRIDGLYEEAGRRIYEAQRARLKDQSSITALREWRSRDVPSTFWDGYCADARAALSALSTNRRAIATAPTVITIGYLGRLRPQAASR